MFIKHREYSGLLFFLGDFYMINNVSEQSSSFLSTQPNQSDNLMASLREFFTILKSSHKDELSTWDTIYLNLVLVINADSETIKNDMSLGNIIYSANNYFNSFF